MLKVKSAKELFEELGYKLVKNEISDNKNYMFVMYEHNWYDYEDTYTDTIKFITNGWFTESINIERILNEHENYIELSTRTIKAIQKQCEELGWND